MVSICIIAIGDELLNGFTVDTNSQWIKEKFSILNGEIQKSIIISDSKKIIKQELNLCLAEEYDYIFISGGLGPTHDDITKKSISEYLNQPLIVAGNHFEDLKKKFKIHYSSNFEKGENRNIESAIKTQAQILENSDPIPNLIGTALGMTFTKGKTRVFVFPGVPKELKCMFDRIIIPKYFSLQSSKFVKTLKTTGITETRLSNLVSEIISTMKMVKISFLPHFTGVNIRIEGADVILFNKAVKKIKKKINNFYYGSDEDTIKSVVSSLLIKNNLSLSIAESCTGGLISKEVTDISGSSKYFKGSIVAYSNEIKETILSVSGKSINKWGAVSKQVASEMCDNIASHFKTDLGLSITGISGPSGGTDSKPIGLYYIGISFRGKVSVKKFIFNTNDRLINREVASFTALNLIRLTLEEINE